MTVHLSPDIDAQGVTPPVLAERFGEHIRLKPITHNRREIIATLAKAFDDVDIRADLMLIRRLGTGNPERARALDRLCVDSAISAALAWCISLSDANDLSLRLEQLT